MTEMRERTEDWIMQAYIKDDPAYGCEHGIYKLIEPRKLICTKCEQVIIDEQEFDALYEWMQFLCKRD